MFKIRDQLAYGLRALAGAAVGNPAYSLEHLEAFFDLVQPLLGSPLVGLSSPAAHTCSSHCCINLEAPAHTASLLGACTLETLNGHLQVGETAAFDAVHALARCLPGVLGKHALAISCALRMIELRKQGIDILLLSTHLVHA